MWGAVWLLAAAAAVPGRPEFSAEVVVADRREVAAPDVAGSVSALDGEELTALPVTTLADALGEAVPYGFPIHPRAALAGIRWRGPDRRAAHARRRRTAADGATGQPASCAPSRSR